ncbi:VWA domain-containing protein [Candidatus Woesearchaeota archaeon]|nr:MAG: VWA domain-containing protein [Candidatus Woesearchaeota archaeon]
MSFIKNIYRYIKKRFGREEADDVREILEEYKRLKEQQQSQQKVQGGLGGEQQVGQENGKKQEASQQPPSTGKKSKRGMGGKKVSGGKRGKIKSEEPPRVSPEDIIDRIFVERKNESREQGVESLLDIDTSETTFEDGEEGMMREWDYEEQSYHNRATYVIRTLSQGSSRDYEFFRENFGHLVESVREELRKLKKRKREKVKGTKRGSRIHQRRAREEVTRVISGKEPKGDIYIKSKERERDYTVAILIDRSSSTRYRVENHTRIQVEKYTALILAEALAELGDSFSVASFQTDYYSEHNLIEYIKRHYEPWDEEKKEIVASLDYVEGSKTPSGVAIRVAIEDLERRKQKNKVLIIITDGRPEYLKETSEEYDIMDTRKAIEEAEEAGIRVVLLTIDPEPSYFRTLSEPASYARAFNDVESLIYEIVDIYKSLRK